MLCFLTLASQGVPTTPQQHVLNEMRDIDVVLKALLGDVKLERESATRTPPTFPATIFGSNFKGGATSKNAGEFNLVKFSLAHEIFNLLKWRLATKPLNFFVPAPHALAEGEVAALVVSR